MTDHAWWGRWLMTWGRITAQYARGIREGTIAGHRVRLLGGAELPPDWVPLPGVPKTRGDCADEPRPCPRCISCRHHMWRVDARDRPGRHRDQSKDAIIVTPGDSCSLDVADRGPRTTHEVASAMFVSIRRVQQLVRQHSTALKLNVRLAELADHVVEDVAIVSRPDPGVRSVVMQPEPEQVRVVIMVGDAEIVFTDALARDVFRTLRQNATSEITKHIRRRIAEMEIKP